MNKKGVLAAYLVDFYAYLVFVAILIIFFILIAVLPPPSNTPEVAGAKVSKDATLVLIRALQTQISTFDKIMTLGEIIATADPKYNKDFEEGMEKIMFTIYPKDPDKRDVSWGVYFKDDIKRGRDACVDEDQKMVDATVDVPLKNRIDYVTVLLCVNAKQ